MSKQLLKFAVHAIYVLIVASLFHSVSHAEVSSSETPLSATEGLNNVIAENEKFRVETAKFKEETKEKEEECAKNPNAKGCAHLQSEKKRVKQTEEQLKRNDQAIAEAKKAIELGHNTEAAKDATMKAVQEGRKTLEGIAGGQYLNTVPSFENIQEWTNADNNLLVDQMKASDSFSEVGSTFRDAAANEIAIGEAQKILAADGDPTAQSYSPPTVSLGQPTSEPPALSSALTDPSVSTSSASSSFDTATGKAGTKTPISPIEASSVQAPSHTATPSTVGTSSSSGNLYSSSNNVASTPAVNSNQAAITTAKPAQTSKTSVSTGKTTASVQSSYPTYNLQNGYTAYPYQMPNGQIQYMQVYTGQTYYNGQRTCQVVYGNGCH